MKKDEAVILLKNHSDFSTRNENSFLYLLKEKEIVNKNLFFEIMDCILVVSDSIDILEIKYIYSIVFWSRSWLDTGYFQDKLSIDSIKKLKVYIQIIEETLYYLLHEKKEEAFWAYNEYLDGRYS